MRAFLIGLQFLTRLKLVNQTQWNMEDFGKSVMYFPIIGLIIGAFIALNYWILAPFTPIGLLAIWLVAFEFLFTGGLHADGFMDTCDGLFSGRDRERKLEIMKDSRVGSNGVVGFVFLTFLKWQLLVNIPADTMISVLLVMPLLSRYTMVLSLRLFPYARPEGMGKAFAECSPKYTLLVATILAVLPILVGSYLYALALGFMIGVNLIINSYVTKHLGGTTGDTYGFTCEISEVLFLVLVLCLGLA